MSEHRKIDFAALPLEPEARGIASHAEEVNGVRWAVVQYEPGVLREEWCTEGHSGYVLEGEVTYEFENGDEPLRLTAGDGLLLPDGAGHRGRSGESGVRLFLIDRAG
jgi:quercetin dioxygenase-like cupin family protein